MTEAERSEAPSPLPAPDSGAEAPAADGARVPEALMDLFQEPALGLVSYHDRHDRIVTWPMWVDVDPADGRLITSSPVGSRKGRALRARPEVSVAIVSTTNPWRWLSISGRVTEIRPDEGLAFIDRMSRRYTGTDYPRRTPRETFHITIDRLSHAAGRR